MASLNGDASIILMREVCGIFLGVTFVQLFPLSFETYINPSSLPAQSTPCFTGDSAKVKISAYTSAPVLSFVIGPPLCFIVNESCRVKSGLITSQLSPRLLLR